MLNAGTRLGSYEILGLVGAGGMGEVYRARDAALGREVAIKVLPPGFTRDAERLHRFMQEAQAAAALDHPNIVAIYQVGQQDNAPFIVSELLRGHTLRERLGEGALPVRKALEYAAQIARGLAAAHDRGIIHRDLKPDNVFVTDDGRVKILDFGVAKLSRPDTGSGDATLTVQTSAGTVLGTIGYMSPEQVRGQSVDARSDLFSLGAMLYEMLSGRRPFHRSTAADTMTAVLKEEPPELVTADRQLPPVLERIVKRCLEKNPQERFQSARDLAFALEDVSSASTSHATLPVDAAPRRKMPLIIAAAAVILLAAGTASVMWAGRTAAPAAQPTFQRVTFRRGALLTARFGPDANTVVYGAAWDGNPPETFVVSADTPESRSLGLGKTDVYAVSRTGELAISQRVRQPFPPRSGVLARVPLLGGAAPRQIRDDVEYADWGPDGSIAVTLDTGVGDRLEYPIGTPVYETSGPIHQIRVSPDGSLVAFEENGPGGSAIAVVDRARKKTTLSAGWLEIDGLAWTPAGDEIWFAARGKETGRGLFAVNRDGRRRVLLQTPGILHLYDIARDGRVLASEETRETGIRYAAPASDQERDLSWLDRSLLNDVSLDGASILFSEIGDAGGFDGAVYLRKTDGSSAVRLGTGFGLALSPDGKWAATISKTRNRLTLLPTGPGSPITLKGKFEEYWGSAEWLSDARRIVFSAMEAGHDPRLYVQDISGEPRPISPEGLITGSALSPDGTRIAALFKRKLVFLPVDGGAPQPIAGAEPGEAPIAWGGDGTSLFVGALNPVNMGMNVTRLEIATGKRVPWRTLLPFDRAGITSVNNVHLSPDGRAYAYSYNRRLSELYIVTGLK